MGADGPVRIGVRELKATLSAVLDDVQEGATVIVTERGRAVATISPIGARSVLEDLIASGKATRGRQTNWLPEPVDAGTTVADLVAELRGR